MSKTFKQAREELAVKSKYLDDIFQEAGGELDFSKVAKIPGDTAAKVAEVQRLNKELDELAQEVEVLKGLDSMAQKAHSLAAASNEPAARVTQPDGQVEIKTVGRLLVESPQYKAFLKGGGGKPNFGTTLDIDLKTVMSTGAGWAPPEIRLPGVVLSAQRPIAVASYFPQFPTSSDTIRYMKETTYTATNAVEKAQQTSTAASDVVGEAALALTETTDEVEWLPVFIPVTMQQMEDVEGIEAYVNQRLSYMLQARLDLQCIQGTGVTPLLLGTNSLGSVLSQAKGTDSVPDAIYKAMTQVRVTGMAEPSVVFIHPNDWQAVRLLTTADGIYIFGSPMDPGVDRIWGIPVLQTTAALENTATLGDYTRFAAIYNKRGITIAVSDSHAFYFTRGTLAIRADMRVAVVHTRDTAFCKVTGI